MFIKSLMWTTFNDFFPNWMELKLNNSNASRLFGYLSIGIDQYCKEVRNIQHDVCSITSEYRDPYETYTVPCSSIPQKCLGYINGKSINIYPVDTWDKMVKNRITRISQGKVKTFNNLIMGINFFTSKKGFPYYLEVLTDKKPYENGAVQAYDQNNTFIYSYLDKKIQDENSLNGDELVYFDINTIFWLEDNYIKYRDLVYDPNEIYYMQTYNLRFEDIIPGTLKVYDAVQSMSGIEIPESGIDVSLGTVGVYNDINPTMRTWWEYDSNENLLTIYNPISSFYVLEYEYYTLKPGPYTRNGAYRSVCFDEEFTIISQ